MFKFASIVAFSFITLCNSPFGDCAAIAGNDSREEEQKPLLFLGRYTHTSVKPPSDQISDVSTVQQTSYYFLSQNAAGWSTAAGDCKAFIGEDATLLYIETAEELAAVTKYLQSSDDTGSTYWTGGKYDPASSTFIWDNGVPVGSFAPWQQGHPDTQLPVTRIAAYVAGGVKLRTQFQTVSNRYICELNNSA